mgnify:CR=1 FL=1
MFFHATNYYYIIKYGFFSLLERRVMSYIDVKDISKTFKVAKRNSGLKAAIKGFIKRDYTTVEAVKDGFEKHIKIFNTHSC